MSPKPEMLDSPLLLRNRVGHQTQELGQFWHSIKSCVRSDSHNRPTQYIAGLRPPHENLCIIRCYMRRVWIDNKGIPRLSLCQKHKFPVAIEGIFRKLIWLPYSLRNCRHRCSDNKILWMFYTFMQCPRGQVQRMASRVSCLKAQFAE